MKPKTLILIVAAVGCGLIASYMTSRLLAERKEQPQENEKVQVLVAKQKIAMGTLIKNPAQFFEKKDFAKGTEPKKALTNLDDLKDKRMNKPLSAEQFVTSDDILDGKFGDMQGSLPPGMRAVAIATNMVASGGGWVTPASRVDVMVTMKRGDNESLTKIVLQNMQVLAVDLFRNPDPEKPAIIPTVVTLAATPEEAERIAMAQAMGEIKLLLRPFGEEQPIHTKGAKPIDVVRGSRTGKTEEPEGAEGAEGRTSSALSGVPDAPFGKPGTTAGEQPKEPPPPHVMVLINGSEVTRAVYQRDHDGNIIEHSVDKQELTPRTERKPQPREPGRDQGKPDKAPSGQGAPSAQPPID